MSKSKPKIIVIEGPVGSGKTTIANALGADFHARGRVVLRIDDYADHNFRPGEFDRYYARIAKRRSIDFIIVTGEVVPTVIVDRAASVITLENGVRPITGGDFLLR